MSLPLPVPSGNNPDLIPFPVAHRSRRRQVADHANRAIVDFYLAFLRSRLGDKDVSEIHLAACDRDLNSFLAYRPSDSDVPMSDLRISESCNADMEAWLLSLRQSNATKRRKRSELVTCFDWAAREGGLIPPNANPYYRSRAMRLPVHPKREAEQTEYAALVAVDPLVSMPIDFLAKTGARPCEMREAKLTDVDWIERVIELFKSKTSRVTGESRVIGLEPSIFEALQKRLAEAYDKSGHIFLNSLGEPWTADAWCRAVRRSVAAAGIDKGSGKRVTSGMFRHFWAGNAEENGCTDREIADGLGHRGTELVSWYSKARKRKGNQRRIAEKASGKRESGEPDRRTENP